MISPFKAVIGGHYKTVEARLLEAIHIRFGLAAQAPAEAVALIKAADRAAAYFEATALAGFAIPEAQKLFGAPKLALGGVAVYLKPMRPAEAQEGYLRRFAELDDHAAKRDPS
jgi:5'-deoxynucleotidase YfbR-like HD superfamily hydrolase